MDVYQAMEYECKESSSMGITYTVTSELPAGIHHTRMFDADYYYKIKSDKRISPQAYSMAVGQTKGHSFYVVWAQESRQTWTQRDASRLTDREKKQQSKKKSNERRSFGSYENEETFSKAYVTIPVGLRCFYQVILSDRPVCFFVDFDHHSTSDMDTAVQAWSKQLLHFMQHFYECVTRVMECADQKVNNDSQWKVLNRHRKKDDNIRLSTHEMDSNSVFENTAVIGLFMRVLCPPCEGYPAYDHKIYTKNRNFLMPFSCKAQSTTPFLPMTRKELDAVANGSVAYSTITAAECSVEAVQSNLVDCHKHPPKGVNYITMGMMLYFLHQIRPLTLNPTKDAVVHALMKHVALRQSYTELVGYFSSVYKKDKQHDTERQKRMDARNRYATVQAVPPVSMAQVTKHDSDKDNMVNVIHHVLDGFFGSLVSMP